MNTFVYNLKRILRTSAFGRSHFYLAIRFFAKRKGMDAVIAKYLGDDVTDCEKRRIKRLMREAMINYRWDFDEFFIFHYEDYDDAKRRSFVPEFDKNVFADLVNDKEQADVFLDKWTTYEYFKQFFKRDVYNIRLLNDLDTEQFKTFVKKHPSFIMKPVFGTRGAGIEVLRGMTVQAAKSRLSEIYNSGETAIVIEELIDQDEAVAQLHKESVNTLRVITIRYDDGVEVIHSTLRMGKGSAVIDNASAGGVLGVVNVKTGKVYAACDKCGNSFECHPDSGVNLIGFEIPRWHEVESLVKQAAQVLPKVRYVGWDIALSKKGCVLIEGNDKSQLGFQIPMQEGFRAEMNAILKRLGKHPIN